MKGIALDLGARHGRIQEIQIEKRVVPHQHRARAVCGANGGAYLAEDVLQGVLFGDRRPQRMVRIDAVHRHRCRLHVRSGKGYDVVALSVTARQRAVAAHLDEYRGDVEQRVGLGIEAAALDVHHHRQKAAKPRGVGDRGNLGHARPLPSRRQAIASPARYGTSVPAPNS